MEVVYTDFLGEIEWVCIGDRIIFDQNYRGLAELIQSSQQEVVKLAASFYNKPIDPNLQIPKLKSLLSQLEYKYEQLYISDLSGYYFNASGNTNTIIDRKYFRQVMSGNTVISEPIINRSTGKPIIAVATPILNKNKVIGLFGLTIELKSSHKGLHYLPTNNKSRRSSSLLKNKNKLNRQKDIMSA